MIEGQLTFPRSFISRSVIMVDQNRNENEHDEEDTSTADVLTTAKSFSKKSNNVNRKRLFRVVSNL